MYKNKDEFLDDRYDPVHNRTIDYVDSPRLHAVLKLLQPTFKHVKLLDVGCYDGYIASLLKKRLGTHSVAYGVDVAKNSITMAKRNGVIAKKCDVAKGICYPANTFDYVFAGEVIEHLYDTDFFMQEVRRVLKPSGVFVITTPNSLSFGRRLNYLFGKGVFLEVSFSIPKNAAGHIRYFTFETLKELAELHGFSTVTMISDTVNFPWFRSDVLAHIFPTLGQSVIALFHSTK